MNLSFKSFPALGLALLLFAALFSAAPLLRAQTPDLNKTSHAEKVDAPETNQQLEAFRHSPAVQSLARRFHVSTEFMAKAMEDLNSVILIGVILWFLFRAVPKMYRRRTETLQKQLFDARLATSEANEKLAAIEERLSKLGVEIDAIRQQTEHDGVNDEKRIRESLETEKQRLVSSIEQEIEAAGAAARRDLKKYAATLAVERAISEIRLTDDDDRALVRSFGADLRRESN
ncbi:MAG TPA: ATP synthase F0 subunit B [Silvibacterium sp.]|nr:ATP synthase F0 subunit B [Silvibacterium sp.]